MLRSMVESCSVASKQGLQSQFTVKPPSATFFIITGYRQRQCYGFAAVAPPHWSKEKKCGTAGIPASRIPEDS